MSSVLKSNRDYSKAKKIGLYIRVSTQEQAANPEGSIKSQEQRLRQAVKFRNFDEPFGEVKRVFIDRAKSGKDTKRPALQEMLKSIKSGEIDLVMVTELSRLSRSLKDFCEMFYMMKELGCGFQSLREQYDTTTAAGEMILYTVANLAQFERRQTSERIAANFHARSQRGLYNGGPVPLGYKLIPEKRGYLAIDEEPALIVKETFKTFLKEGSLAQAGKSLNDRGFKIKKKTTGGGDKRLGYFTTDNLHGILTRVAYIGKKAVKNRSGEIELVDACWPAIVDEKTFYRVGDILKKNHRRFKPNSRRRYPYLLSRLTSCGVCGDRLTGKSAHGQSGKVPYYEHGWATRKQSCQTKKFFKCENHKRFQARKLEPAVWSEIEKLLSSDIFAQKLTEKAKSMYKPLSQDLAKNKLREKSVAFDRQLEALAEHLTKLPMDVSPQPVFNQMQKIEKLKKEVGKEIDALGEKEIKNQPPIDFDNYKDFLRKFKKSLKGEDGPEVKRKIAEKLIHKIELLPEGFKLHFYMRAGHFDDPSLGQKKSIKKGVSIRANPSSGPSAAPQDDMSKLFGSNSLTNGGAAGIEPGS